MSDTRIGLCWRPARCPGTAPAEFYQLLWHRTGAGQAVPALCCLVANSLGKVAGEGESEILNQMVFP